MGPLGLPSVTFGRLLGSPFVALSPWLPLVPPVSLDPQAPTRPRCCPLARPEQFRMTLVCPFA
jgi:hypothetical protein